MSDLLDWTDEELALLIDALDALFDSLIEQDAPYALALNHLRVKLVAAIGDGE